MFCSNFDYYSRNLRKIENLKKVAGLDSRAAESGNVNLTVGLGLAAMSKIVTGSERNWGHVLLRHLGWKDGQGIGARRKAKVRHCF